MESQGSITEITAQANGSYRFVDRQPFEFANGEVLCPLELVYETYGQLNDTRDNVILVHHALSTNSHLAANPQNPEPGWWQAMVGPGKCLDTARYFIICINNLGSCFGASGPASTNPATGERYGMAFPAVTFEDMARSQKRLLDSLGITHLHALVGSSMGAMLSLTWATLYPDHASYLVSISTSAMAYPANSANRQIQNEIIRQDPAWNHGRYSNSGSLEGFRIARKFALMTYRNWAEMNDRFIGKQGEESIEHYLDYNARKFTHRFDCNCYLYLLKTMDNFDPRSAEGEFEGAFSPIKSKVRVVSVDSDILYTPSQQQYLYQALHNAGVAVEYINHHSEYGHDAFLVETDAFDRYIGEFISSTH